MTNGIGHEFMKRTQYRYMGMSDQSRGLPQPPLQTGHDQTQPVVELPAPVDVTVASLDLREAIENRRSVRKYTKAPLPLPELSYLLWCTQGVKGGVSMPVTLRTVPSAGARHAFETYLLVNNVQGLTPGLYRFLAVEHKLVEINLESGLSDRMVAACGGQRMVKAGAVTFAWTVDSYRMTWRYGERGYRYMHLDAGHVCQNMYLAAESIDCGVCAIAAFDDEAANRLLGLDGEEQFVIYFATVGKKPA